MSTAITKEQVVSFIENMSVLELSQLVKELENKFGVRRRHRQVGSLAGAAHLLNDNAGVLRRAQ